jgi:hypothetical protein
MESLLKAKKKLVSSMKKQHADIDDKRKAAIFLEEQLLLKALKTETRKAKVDAKQKESVSSSGKRTSSADTVLS